MFIHLRTIYAILTNKRKFEEIIQESEKAGIFITVIPCDLVISDLHLQYSINAAIRDFKFEQNIAKKISMQILLRFLGERQINIALKKATFEEGADICLIFTAEKHDDISTNKIAENIIKKAKSTGALEKISLTKRCRPDLEKIIEIYDIVSEELEAISRGDENQSELLEKIILERCALTLLK